jgi:hypothetical protein
MGDMGLPLALPPELCVHHDEIEMAKGPVSKGRCKYCGREKEYENASPWKTYNKAALTVRDG